MRLPFVASALAALVACGPSDGQLCARFCGDTTACAAGTGFDVLACQDSCEASAETDEAYLEFLECVYESDGDCMTGYPECESPS